MIRCVRANKPTFRSVKFQPGFNVVLADKTNKSGRKDSRNGAGKSLLVEIIHFCLGGSAGTSLKKKELHDWRFTLDVQFGGKELSVTRGLDHPNKVEVAGDASFVPTDLFRPLPGGSFQIKSTEWARALGTAVFGLPTEERPQPFAPRFRNLLPFFARSGRDAFASPFRHHRQTKSEALYDVPGNLIIEVGKNGYQFEVGIQRTGATGIENKKVFCYDLTLAQLRSSQSHHPGLLLHDSPMFDGVDERQKAAAWARAKAESERLGFQYICMVNTDDIPAGEVMQGLDIRDESLVRAVLIDQPDDCLLGMRF